MRYGYRRVHIVLRRGGPKIGLTAEAGKLCPPAIQRLVSLQSQREFQPIAIHKTGGSSPPSGYRKAQLHIHRSERSVRSASSDSTELFQNVFCRTQFRSRALALALN